MTHRLLRARRPAGILATSPAASLAASLAIPLLLAAVSIGAWAVATPVRAQSNVTGGILGPGSATGGGSQQNGKPAPPRAPALPGTRAEKTAPAAPDRAASDMAPNETLFDGINRGDMAYVKDAISRGAELNARNVLGLTPIDLSVDLGRTDITFLLLSLRGTDNGSSAGPGKQANTGNQTASKAEPKSARISPVRTNLAGATKMIAPARPANPKLFANDGGVPVPNAGFLGFDAQR